MKIPGILGIPRIPWGSRESHGNPENPMGIPRIPWESWESQGNPGNPMEILGISWESQKYDESFRSK
jgi:hypothetical protein